MGTNKFWAGDIEINLPSFMFIIKIIIYKENINIEEEQNEEVIDIDENEYLNSVSQKYKRRANNVIIRF